MYDSEEYTLSAYEALLDDIIGKVRESYEGSDVVVLASLFDEALSKEGIFMPFAWLWSKATFALIEW